ncbi:hypothetical protein EAF00_007770 [Botryotinia globosa]|nr:hypothetical protein EAF00_007770 [Botryotinia globosa]
MKGVPTHCWLTVPKQTNRRLGDLPLEIINNVMELLGWEGSTCLGLTCPELYAAYRALYPSKVPLQSLVDTSLPFRLYPVTDIEMAELYPPIELYKLVGDWSGLKDQYFFWKDDRCWRKESAGFAPRMTTALDIPSSGVPIPDLFLLASKFADKIQNMKILQERYEDYKFTRSDFKLTDFDEDGSSYMDTKGANFLLQGSRIPSPFNLGAEWDSNSKKVIVESINLASTALFWKSYWKHTNIWQRNFLYFNQKWESAEAVEKALDNFREWIEMIGF